MNYYQILKVSKNASNEEIRNSYISLIKKYHPDVYKGNKEFANKTTKELNDAYDILSNPKTRAEYDLSLEPPTKSQENSTSSNNFYNTYSYYKKQYSNIRQNKRRHEPTVFELFQKKLHEKLYNFVDKHTSNLNKKSKILLLMIILFFVLLLILISIHDFLFILNLKQ